MGHFCLVIYFVSMTTYTETMTESHTFLVVTSEPLLMQRYPPEHACTVKHAVDHLST